MKRLLTVIALSCSLNAADFTPLLFGVSLPFAERALNNQNTGLSAGNIGNNWRNRSLDFNLKGDNFKRDVLMHGHAGALGYLRMRTRGNSAMHSALGSLSVGIGIELSQGLERKHPISCGDIARTTLYGALLGEAYYRIAGKMMRDDVVLSISPTQHKGFVITCGFSF